MNKAIPTILMLALMSGATARPGRAAAQDLAPARVVPIQVNGDPATHFSLVILGDGYTARDMDRFRAHVDRHLNILWSLEPFRSYRSYFNVYAVEITSPESGITCDPAHREQRKTALGLYFDGGCTNPNARAINVEQEEARRYARMATPEFDQILTIANTDTYGGVGGGTATTSGGNALSPYITPHEIGHSLGRLQDEYTYSARGVKGTAYTGREPASRNHTIMTEDEMRTQQKKWWRWLGEPSEAGGVIGRFEGGQTRSSGTWRPSRHSMMISLGYYFDQVSREQLTERISARVDMITASTPTTAPVPRNAILWIETAHPVYHEMRITWSIDGVDVPRTHDAPALDLAKLNLDDRTHTVSVRAVDPTEFVKDPAIRDTSLTGRRTWTTAAADPKIRRLSDTRPGITASTPTTMPVSGSAVVYIETTHAPDRIFNTWWMLDDKLLSDSFDSRTLNLAELKLAKGTHTLRARVTDPGPSEYRDARTWTIDNTPPTVTYELQGDTSSVVLPDGSRHYTVHDSFTMKLVPKDDMPGFVVAEFRVNGDGWHHYYGWPDAPPGSPFRFTARGTNIKELIYGSLSSEGLSPQPWEAREPGWGTHTIEYRARDAAGNIGETRSFKVTISPSR